MRAALKHKWLLLRSSIIGVIVGRYVARWQHRVQEATGRTTYPGTAWTLTVLLFAVIGWFAWPMLSFLAPVFGAISDFIAEVPPIVVSIVIAVGAIAAAVLWIRNFFESRRT